MTNEKEKKFDINDIVDHFKSLFSAEEIKLINHIIKHENDIFRIYNTLSSLFMGVIVSTIHSVEGNKIILASCISMCDIVDDDIFINFTLPHVYSQPLCIRTKTSLPKIFIDRGNNYSLNFLGNEGEIAVFGGNEDTKVTRNFVTFYPKDFWGIRKQFISQFASDMDMQRIPPHFIFGEFKFNDVEFKFKVTSEIYDIRRATKNFTLMQEFYLFCKSKYSSNSIDDVKGEYQVTQPIDSDDIYQDEGKRYILKVFNRERMSEDEICNELFIFLFMSYILQVESCYPKLLSWNLEFILIEFVNARPIRKNERPGMMFILLAILEKMHNYNLLNYNLLNIFSLKKYSFNPGSIFVNADNNTVCILDFGLKETTIKEDNYKSNMTEFISLIVDQFMENSEIEVVKKVKNMMIDEIMMNSIA